MRRATRPFIDRIALVFDFDLTLAPGSIDATLARFGIDYGARRSDELQPLVAGGWDQIQAKGMLLQRLSRADGNALTRDFLAEVGRELEPFPGARRRCEISLGSAASSSKTRMLGPSPSTTSSRAPGRTISRLDKLG